jgi:autotransporter translocation and assembly factor TamB
VIRLTAVGVGGLVALAVLTASVVLQGPRLGAIIEGTLPPQKGKMHIGGVVWHLRALVDIVTDEPSPIAVDGLQIVDPEGTVVLDVPHLEARVKLRTLIKGSFSIHDLQVPKALWRFAQMKGSQDIGFLAALAPRDAPPPKPAADAGKPEGPGSFFEIASAELGDLNAIFDFPGAWGLELRQAHARASLIQSAVDPKHPVFGFDAGPVVASGGGWLRILDDNTLPFDRVNITRVSTTQDRPDDIFLDLAEALTGKSRLTGKGWFTGIYGLTPGATPGIALEASFENAGDALSAVVAGKGIAGLTIADGREGSKTGSQTGSRIDLHLHQPFAALKVAAEIRGLDVKYQDYAALGVGFDLGFDMGKGRVDVKRFGLGAPGGGKMDLDATLDINKLALDAGLKLTAFHTESYLPRGLRALGGGVLDGRVDASADLAHQSARIKRLDLRLARAAAAGLPRNVRVHGDAQVSRERAQTSGLTVDVAGASATAKGSVDLERKLVQAGLEVVASDLARLLREMSLPPLGQDARLTAEAHGPLDAPVASGEAVVHGISAAGRKLPELKARFAFQDGVARLDDLSGPAFGGTLRARGQLRLMEAKEVTATGAGGRRRRAGAPRPLASPVVDATVEARDLDVGVLAGSDKVAGRISLSAEARGPLDHLEARVRVPAGTPLAVLGDDYALGPVDVALSGTVLDVRALRALRKAGGTLEVTGKVGQIGTDTQDLDLAVVLDKLPLEGLPGVADAGVPVSGFVSARLHVGGRPDRPELSGDVDLAKVAVRGAALGGGHLALSPARVGSARDPGVAIRGLLFDRLNVDAQAALTPAGPSVHGAVTFQKLVLEALLPELGDFADGHGVASGRVNVDLDPGRPLALDVTMPELWLSIARAVEKAPGEAGVERVRVEAARPLHVTVNGDHIVLDEAHLTTDGGELVAAGRLDGKAVRGSMSGHLDLELLQPFLRGELERIGGDLSVELSAGGTVDKPLLQGAVNVQSAIKLRPKTFDSDVTIGSGKFALDASGVSVQGLAVTVEGSTVTLAGHAGLGPGFAPQDLEADVAGDVNAKLLAFVAPDALSDARGTARIRAQLRGTPQKPDVRGRLDLGDIHFRLRDLGTEVQVQSGIVEISNGGLILHNVKVTLDDQGTLVIGASGVRAGRVQFTSLVPFKPGWVDLPLHGERLTYRSPGTFEVDDLAFDLDLKGNVDDGFDLGGEVRLVSGRYLQDFKVQNLVLSPRVDESSVRPFYEGQPLLEGLGLDLAVRTVGEGFVVQNNLAPEIHVDISLHVSGTLSEPALGGEIRPTDGRFNIPGMRGDFDLTPNVSSVLFVASKSIADGDTPDLDIEAQNLLTDASGADHTVRIRIHGPVRESQIDLSTDDGLDRNQTALLLITGRTSTDSQRFGTQNPTVGANISTGADVAGQLTRDTLANLMEPYIDDTFYRLTSLNLRLTVGPDGFEGRIRKNISRKLTFQTDYLQGFQNQSHWTTKLDYWLRDYVTFGGGVERITLSSQQGVAETLPLNYSLELRLDYPIRR